MGNINICGSRPFDNSFFLNICKQDKNTLNPTNSQDLPEDSSIKNNPLPQDKTNIPKAPEPHEIIRLKRDSRLMERIKVLDSNVKTLGLHISVEDMKRQIHPDILRTQKALKVFELTHKEKENLEENLLFRRPFQYNFDKSIYHGSWNKTGLREGYGVYVKRNGTLVEGIWKNGRIFRGRIFYSDLFYYEGDIEDEYANGKGKKIGPKGEVYSGQWIDGKQSGQGTRLFEDKSEYSGSFLSDLFSGQGKFKWADGSFYEGQFFQSQFKGHGKYESNGDSYEGLWADNLPNGKGVYLYSQGGKYEGNFLNGRKEGEGKYEFGNNSYYSGQWKDGLPQGVGEYMKQNSGNILKGLWRCGRLISDMNNFHGEDVFLTIKNEKFKFGKELNQLNRKEKKSNTTDLKTPIVHSESMATNTNILSKPLNFNIKTGIDISSNDKVGKNFTSKSFRPTKGGEYFNAIKDVFSA